MMNIEVNGNNIKVKLYNNSSADALKELLKKGPLTISMKDYAQWKSSAVWVCSFPQTMNI